MSEEHLPIKHRRMRPHLYVASLLASTLALFACGGTAVPIAAPVTPSISYVAGQTYYGRNSYIEYIAGNAPVLLTAPHGGTVNPSTIPDRTPALCGGAATTVTDLNTAELVRAMRQQFFAKFGKWPHVVIANISRRKLDANRPDGEAACGNADAQTALEDWRTFVNAANTAMLKSYGKGWYMDMHGHGHAIQRLELGYLLSNADVNRTDAVLDANPSFENSSSIRTLSQQSPLSFSALLRGPLSLGTLYAALGFPSVPSATDPTPNADPYFDGGENTRLYSCSIASLGSAICGVQIESNYTGVRDTAANRDRFGDATAIVIEEYLRVHWGLRLSN